MYEYGIYNIKTNERNVIFGRTFEKACERAKLNPEDWDTEYCDYID